MRTLLCSLALLPTGLAHAADTPGAAAPAVAAPTATVTPVGSVDWKPLDPKKPAGVQIAVLQGDLRGGPTSFFMKFPAGSASPEHAHTHDYHGVVVSGTPGHGATADAAATPLAAGSWWNQPGMAYHYDRCHGPSECVLLLTFPNGGFDYVPAR